MARKLAAGPCGLGVKAMKPTCVTIRGMPEGDGMAARVVRFIAAAPSCHSSTPASAPWACTASVTAARARTSDLSHKVAQGNGESSELGSTEQAPVQTTPQTPSAFIPRKAARTSGAALVMPLAWGTGKKRFFAGFGPIRTGSNKRSWRGLRGICVFLLDEHMVSAVEVAGQGSAAAVRSCGAARIG